MEIRSFRTTDTEHVIEIWNQCGLVKSWNDPQKDISRKIKVDPELFLVGLLDDSIVATVMAGYEGHRGWVNYLAVSPHSRKQGLAGLLMEEIERLLLKRGCPKINLQIRNTNLEAVEFYRSVGYEIDDSIGMGKRLISDT
jgi:ribosomal protein S18 acetylase RimI-like enzyme